LAKFICVAVKIAVNFKGFEFVDVLLHDQGADDLLVFYLLNS